MEQTGKEVNLLTDKTFWLESRKCNVPIVTFEGIMDWHVFSNPASVVLSYLFMSLVCFEDISGNAGAILDDEALALILKMSLEDVLLAKKELISTKFITVGLERDAYGIMREALFVNLETFRGEDKHLIRMIIGLVNRISKKVSRFS
jgi:hypothetical protein